MNLYRIHWKSTLTGFGGSGVTTYPRQTAQDIADAMNKMPAYKTDGITHWIEPVGEQVARPIHKAAK